MSTIPPCPLAVTRSPAVTFPMPRGICPDPYTELPRPGELRREGDLLNFLPMLLAAPQRPLTALCVGLEHEVIMPQVLMPILAQIENTLTMATKLRTAWSQANIAAILAQARAAAQEEQP